jgi:hypothetical protein
VIAVYILFCAILFCAIVSIIATALLPDYTNRGISEEVAGVSTPALPAPARRVM